MQAQEAASDPACKQWVESTLARLTQEEKVGQLVVAAVPAKNESKKLVRELVRTYKVGGLLFTEGTAEAQAQLTNLAQKNAATPLLFAFDSRRSLSLPLAGCTAYPPHRTVACITDAEVLETYRKETTRQFAELNLHPTTSAQLKENGMELVDFNLYATINALKADVASGKITAAQLDGRCRKALAYKYTQGVRNGQPVLLPKGITTRIHTNASQQVADRLRRAAVTVLCNHFGVLPLNSAQEGGIAVLSVGDQPADSTFVAALQQQAQAKHFRLTWKADEAARRTMLEQLAAYRRVIISVSDLDRANDTHTQLLIALKPQGAKVYTFFTSQSPLLALAPALTEASAVVLAHSAETGVQQQVADVLFARATASGRIERNIGFLFPAGTGCRIEPGMEGGSVIPEDFGMRSAPLLDIEKLAQQGVDEGAYPGCRVLVWKEGKSVYDRSFGTHSPQDKSPVQPGDLFDLAGMTKTNATLLAVMKLYDEGRLQLTDKLSKHIPTLRTTNKRDLTVRDLLMHESGLPPYVRFYMELIDAKSVHGPYSQSWEDDWHHTRVSEHGYYSSDFKFKRGMTATAQSATHTLQMADGVWINKGFRNTIMQQIARQELGNRLFVESELGFVLLQQVVENLTKMPLDSYVEQTFYTPMGLQRTLYRPLKRFGKADIMPTAMNDYLRRQDLCGHVHDEIAACLGGVAGNAGLFSTAEEVAAIYQMLLNGGEWQGKRYLSEATCRLFLTEKSAISHRGLGFDKPNTQNLRRSPCSASTPAEVFGHTGNSGVCVWADPVNNLVYVFLSNHLCPQAWSKKLGELDTQRKIQEAVYESLK